MRLGGLIVLAVIACSGCDDDAATLPDGFANICENDVVPWVKNVTGSPAWDSMEIRDPRPAREGGGVKTLDKMGTPCATATDKPKCEAAYAAIDAQALGDVPAFVGTRGNDVVMKHLHELGSSIVGPVDTPHEAAVLAVGGREKAPFTCANGQLVGVKRNAGNFEVASITVDACTGKKTRVISAVETNGSVRELQTDSLAEGEPKLCER